jgi:hypothetical protein
MSPTVIAEPYYWLGETFGFWAQTVVLAISAGGALWIVRARGTQEKRRATVDLISHQKRDEKLEAARTLMHKLHDDGEKNLAKFLLTTDSKEFQSILLVLNAYEFVAAGIRQGALDEKTYKRLRCYNLMKDWDALCGFVLEFRRIKGFKTLFQDFQWLNERWVKNPLKADDKSPILK